MLKSMLRSVGVLVSLVPVLANAQAFPDQATTPSSNEIKKFVEIGLLTAKIADGTSWRLEYKSSGYFFLNTSTGLNSSGKWQPEEGKLCGALQGREWTCNEVRMHKGTLLYKRDNGEIVEFTRK